MAGWLTLALFLTLSVSIASAVHCHCYKGPHVGSTSGGGNILDVKIMLSLLDKATKDKLLASGLLPQILKALGLSGLIVINAAI